MERNRFVTFAFILMFIMVVGGLAVSYKRGDISSPRCGGYSERINK